MKYAVEIGSGAMIYIPHFIKIGSGIQKLIGVDTQDTQIGRCSHKPTLGSRLKQQLEPFLSTRIATGQDGGLGRHLLVDAVLQASQVEVGISRKETENNAGSMGASETDSVSDTGVTYEIETNRSNQQGDQDCRKDLQAQPN
jgi:hypothetical protein